MDAVKLLGISGSPRAAATEHALSLALSAAAGLPGVETEQINLRGKHLNCCVACYACQQTEPPRCTVFDDDINPLYTKLLEADALLLASPVYNMGISPLLQTLFQRLKPLGRYTKAGCLALKPAAAIAVGGSRNGGQESTLTAMNNLILSLGMVNVSCGVFAYNGAAVWSNDRRALGVDEDVSGVDQLEMLGRRLAAMGEILRAGQAANPQFTPLHCLGFSGPEAYEQRLGCFHNREKAEQTGGIQP